MFLYISFWKHKEACRIYIHTHSDTHTHTHKFIFITCSSWCSRTSWPKGIHTNHNLHYNLMYVYNKFESLEFIMLVMYNEDCHSVVCFFFPRCKVHNITKTSKLAQGGSYNGSCVGNDIGWLMCIWQWFVKTCCLSWFFGPSFSKFDFIGKESYLFWEEWFRPHGVVNS